MPLTEVMNADGTLAHGSGSPVTGGSFTITSIPSSKVKAMTKGVYFGTLSFTFAGGNLPGYDPGTVTGGGSISPTALKVSSLTQFVMRLNDSGTMNVTGTIAGVPTPFPSPVPVTVNSAGQIKVKAQ